MKTLTQLKIIIALQELAKDLPRKQARVVKTWVRDLSSALDYTSLLHRVFEIEKVMYGWVNDCVHPIQVDLFKQQLKGVDITPAEAEKSIQKMRTSNAGSLKQSVRLIQSLGQINKICADVVPTILESLPDADPVKFIASKIGISSHPFFADAGESVKVVENVFLEQVRNRLVLSLLQVGDTAIGRDFLMDFKAVMEQFPVMLTANGNFILLQASISDYQGGSLKAAAIRSSDADVKMETSATFPEYFTSHNSSAGSISQFFVPLWPVANQSVYDLPNYFCMYTVDSLLDRAMLGSFSVDKDLRLFYSPLHMDVVHEFIHIFHNLRGENLENVIFNTGNPEKDLSLRAIWHNPEEFWTISAVDGARFAENKFLGETTVLQRFGHLGMALCTLMPEFELQPLSLSPAIEMKTKLST